jgi:hypothetical protein
MIINHLVKSENKSCVNYQKVRYILLSVGMITLSLGLLLPRLFNDNSIDFISGFFIGISIVANTMSIVLIRKIRK